MDLRQRQARTATTADRAGAVLERLERLPPGLRIAAIRDALPHAGEAERGVFHIELIAIAAEEDRGGPGILRTLLRSLSAIDAEHPDAGRDRRRAVALLASDWHRLAPEHRRVADSVPAADWCHALAGMLDTPEPPIAPVRALVEHLGDRTPETAIARLLAATDRSAADLAERLLARLVSPHIVSGPPELPRRLAALLEASASGDRPRHPQADRRRVAGLLIDLLARQDEHHRSTPALLTLAMLDRPVREPDDAALRAVLDAADHPAAPVLRRVLRRDASPLARRVAWRLLVHDRLGQAALERVASTRDAAEHEAVLEHAHLALNPRRARALGVLRSPEEKPARAPSRSTPPHGPVIPTEPHSLSVRARRGLARYAAALRGGPAHTPDALHVAALTEPDRHARLAHAGAARGPCLVDYCFDPDPVIARTATLRWSTRGAVPPGTRTSEHRTKLAQRLSTSPHACVRRLVLEEPGAAIRHPGTTLGRLEFLADTDEDERSERLAHAFDSAQSPDRRVAILEAARRLGALHRWQRRLVELLTAPGTDARVASAAASAIRSLPGAYPGEAVARALGHADDRVRANAVDSIARLLGRGIAPETARAGLIELKSARAHRVRANAVRADAARPSGAPLESAGPDIERMLTDDRTLHRLAGAWLAERVLCAAGVEREAEAWQRAAHRVACVARDEADDHVRARAKRCARRLLHALGRTGGPRIEADPAARSARAAVERFASAHAGEEVPA
jgi:hypothetical protein